MSVDNPHITVTREAGAALMANPPQGPVTMLNLLRFREVADYTDSPELAPDGPISGAEAYALYGRHTIPLLQAAGGEVVFTGDAGSFLIGPADERWDHVLLVRYPSIQAFMGFATDPTYLKTMGHRTAALEDSRLLPITAS